MSATNAVAGTIQEGNTVEAPLWTRTYMLICASGFLAYTNYAFLNATIALFIADLGGSTATVGLALALYNTVSFTIRPGIGRVIDAGRAREVIGIGSFLLSLGTFAYLVPTMAWVFIGRIVQGAGWAGLNMGTYATVAGIAPPSRRGEASGYFQMSLTTAGAVLPSVGLWLLGLFDYQTVFIIAGIAAMLSALTTLGIPRVSHGPSRREASLLKSLFEPSALLPSSILFLMNAAFPAAVLFIPLYARGLAIQNVAIFFLAQGVVSVATQGGLGRLSDRIGRVPAIAAGLIGAVIGLLLLAGAGNLVVLSAGGAIFMFGFGMINPALFAMVMDRAPREKLGAATATFTISFQAGKAVGSFIGGFLITLLSFQSLYVISAVPLAAAFVVLFLLRDQFAARAKREDAPGGA